MASGRVSVSSDVQQQILSISQDIIYSGKKGRYRTVKSLGLAVAIRNLTGNKEVLTILNRFGHTVSYDTVQDYEKALVRKYHGEQLNSITLPSTTQRLEFANCMGQ